VLVVNSQEKIHLPSSFDLASGPPLGESPATDQTLDGCSPMRCSSLHALLAVGFLATGGLADASERRAPASPATWWLAQLNPSPARPLAEPPVQASALPSYNGPGRCLLQVEGRKYLEGNCQIEQKSDSLKIMPARGRPLDYFATILIDPTTGALGYWNGERGANHAHYDLGELRREGQCWVSETARICATPAPSRAGSPARQ
jgi:hypothetical protein